MAKEKVFISTTSFAEFDPGPVDILKGKGLELFFNPYKRKLTPDELVELAAGCAGLIAGVESLNAEALSRLGKLKVISRCGAGLDNVDLVKAKELNIKVYNTPDAPTLAVAELTVGLMLSLLRRVSLMDRQLRQGKWNKLMGRLLTGKKVGIVGMGRIGLKVAELLRAFEVEIFYADVKQLEPGESKATKCGLEELLSKVDIVTIHIPYDKKNEYLIDAKRIALLKKESILINCSRAKIVDEEALYIALKEGKIAGAALDVFEQEPYSGPLRELDNAILTPHIGSYARESRIKMEQETSLNLLKGLGYA